MSIFENFEKKLQAEPKSIVFTEGTDARILSAASRLLAGKTLKVILLGEVEAVKKAAADGSFDITGAEIIDPTNYAGFDEMVAKMVELRKGKMTDEQCRAEQDFFWDAPLPRAGAVLVQPHQAETDDVHDYDVNKCSIHASIILCVGAKGKRWRGVSRTPPPAVKNKIPPLCQRRQK